MNCSSNIITANFSGGRRKAKTAWRHQWDRGQVLCVTGIDDLPLTFTAHFSVHKEYGAAQPVEGIDGQVEIPDIWLTFGKQVYCWIYLTDGESGETVYTITIPVIPRPMPEYYEMEDTGVFDEVVAEVNGYAESANDAATRAAASAEAAAGSASAAAASASSAAGSAGAAEQARADAVTAKGQAETAAQTATGKAQQTAQSAEQAASDAGRAESAAERAETAETGAETAKTAAEAAAQGAAGSASAAGQSATAAGASATAAAQSASAAAQSAASIEGDVQTATQKASEASASATAAAASETAAQTAQTAAETASTNAGQSASTATTKAAEAAQSASNAAQSKTNAEAAATRAEQAAASLTVDSALSSSSENPVQNKVITGELTDVKSAIDALKIVDTASGAIASFPDGAAMPMEGLTVELEPIQAGSGDPSPDNVRPITGRDAVTVTRTGKNLFNQDAKYASFKQADGSFLGVMNPNITSVHTAIPSAIVGKEVTFSAKMKVPSGSTIGNLRVVANIGGVARNGTLVNDSDYSLSYITFTPSSTDDYVYLSFGSGGAQQVQFKDVMLALGTDTAYHPYDGQSATIQLGTTVYGGTVDVTAGVMTVTDAMVDLGTLNWTYQSTYNRAYSDVITNILPPVNDDVSADAICSVYPVRSVNGNADKKSGISTSKRIWVYDSNYSNASEYKQELNGTQFCYKLATPQTLTLTPEQMTTLKGQNNVWSDADSVSVEYVADPKLYIEKKITAAVAALA